MAAIETIRIKDIPTTATTAAADDYIVIDGATNKVRKGLASNLITPAAHNADAGAHSWSGAFRHLRQRLTKGSRTATMLIVGDSTSVGSANPPYLFASALAASAPAYNVRCQSFTSSVDNGNNTWGRKVNLWTCPAGESRIDFSGAGAATLPVWPATGALGSLGWRIDVDVAPSDFLKTQRFLYLGSGDKTQLMLSTKKNTDTISNLAVHFCTTDGTSFDGTAFCTAPIQDVVSPSSRFVARFEYSGDDAKTFRFYVSLDGGATFTKLGADVVVAIGPYTGAIDYGWTLGGFATFNMTGSVYGVEVWQLNASGEYQLRIPNSIGNWRPAAVPGSTDPANWAYAGGPTLDIMIGAAGGFSLANFIAAGWAPRPAYWANPFTDLILFGAHHNLTTSTDGSAEMKTLIGNFVTYAEAACPGAALCFFTELPLSADPTYGKGQIFREETQRKVTICATYAKRLGLSVIDTHAEVQRAFTQAEIDTAIGAAGSGIHYQPGTAPLAFVADIFRSAMVA